MHWRTICCSSRKTHIPMESPVGNKMLLVRIAQGILEGAFCESGHEKYIAFKGIPYAKPPLGKLRFKAPEPPETWVGVRDGSKHGPVCPQYNERMDRIDPGNEDCLYLNVYTKSLTPTLPLPVMVWIHGGGFYTGSGNSDFYGPDFFMTNDVILVTINYRLEVLGFLCLDTEDVPGNAGLKDQVLALEWVKRNIAVFGGDSNNITIFGCSAGSASISYHLVSKMSEGLFDKVICQSGVCLNEWSYNIYARQRAFQLGKALGKDTEDPAELLDFLRSLPVLSLVNIDLPALDIKYNDLANSILFGPVLEKAELKVKKFITEPPPDLVKKGQFAKVPVILGYTSGEGIEIARKLAQTIAFMSTVGSVVPRELKLKWPSERIQDADKKIRNHYFSNREISTEMVQEVVDLETDRLFAYNIVRFARYCAKSTSKPVYLYKFTAETERNYTKKKYNFDSVEGVCHADELPYLFNITNLDIPITEESRSIIKKITKLWSNFAKTGNPSLLCEAKLWNPLTEYERNCFIIGKEMKCILDPDKKNMDFWEDIYGEKYLTVEGH